MQDFVVAADLQLADLGAEDDGDLGEPAEQRVFELALAGLEGVVVAASRVAAVDDEHVAGAVDVADRVDEGPKERSERVEVAGQLDLGARHGDGALRGVVFEQHELGVEQDALRHRARTIAASPARALARVDAAGGACYVARRMIDDREKRLAALAWAVSGAFGPVVPLIIFAMNYKKSKFIGFHALQAALSFVVMVAAAVLAGIGAGGGTAWVVMQDGMPGPDTPMPEPLRVVMLLVAGLIIAVYLATIVVSLKFATRAAQGDWVVYPGVNRLAATLYDVSDIRVAKPQSAKP